MRQLPGRLLLRSLCLARCAQIKHGMVANRPSGRPIHKNLVLTGKRILVDISVFHDDLEIVSGVGNEADIVQRISVDKQ
jgi:hypothetical protein